MSKPFISLGVDGRLCEDKEEKDVREDRLNVADTGEGGRELTVGVADAARWSNRIGCMLFFSIVF